MMNQPRYFQKDTYHHLYNRGTNKNDIYIDFFDFRYFKEKLLLYKLKHEVEIICYCLMPNHFHLFVRQTKADKPLGRFIGDLANSYTKTFNKKYKRSGVLFEGRTKNKILYEERDFPKLIKYILLNPVRAKLCKRFDEYEYSSGKELMGKSADEITDKLILNYFVDIKEFEKYILLEEDTPNLEGRIWGPSRLPG